MKSILILGAGEMQVPIISKVKELGYSSIVVDANPNALGRSYANEFYTISTDDYDNILKIALEKSINGILTTSDYPVNIVARIGEALHLSTMSLSVAQVCTNKFLQRRIFSKYPGINSLEFFKIESLNDIINLDIRNYPYIIKPLDSSASRGVKKINCFSELIDQLPTTLGFSRSGMAILEEYVEGKEFSVETFTQCGKTKIIAITEKLTIGEQDGYYVEDTHIIPARISNFEKKLIEDQVKLALKSIGVNNCPTHTEVKLNKRGVFIIEIACRLGGDYITSDLVPLATGVDMLANNVKLSLGLPIDTSITLNKYSAIQFINTKNYNICKELIENNKFNNDLRIKKTFISPYHEHTIKSSLDRMGYIIIQADSQKEIEELLSKVK